MFFFIGTLIGPAGGKYYQTWANYYLKFFQSYKQQNIDFWAVTAQNEPTDGTFLIIIYFITSVTKLNSNLSLLRIFV